jgi:GntR family transcriptional regulator
MSAPLWESTAAAILAEMTAGRLADGARLPPEREMAASMGVAVGTLRRALADIESRGLLERIQGSGNYVRAAGLGAQVYGLFRLEPACGGRARPTADTLSAERGAPPEGLEAPALRIRRLRRLDGAAVALEEIWLGGVASVPRAEEIGDSLYLAAAARMGLRIDAVEDRVGPGAMPGWSEGAGPFAPGAPCGHVERLGHDRAGRLRERSQTWFAPGRARYVNRAGRTLPPAPRRAAGEESE